jgi:hypothetical protein
VGADGKLDSTTMPKKSRIRSDNVGNPWHRVDPGEDVPNRFIVIIEIPMGSSNKYEETPGADFLEKCSPSLALSAYASLKG